MHNAFLFPGQGSQYVGMGEDIFNQSPDTEAVPAGYSGKILEYTADNRVDVQKKYQMGA